MKRIVPVVFMVVLIVMLFTATAFAEGGTLVLKDTFPKDGATGTSIENMAVKLYFEGTLTAEKLGTKNDKAVKLYGPDDNELPVKVLYDKKEDGVVLVLLDSTQSTTDKEGKEVPAVAQGNSSYKMVISPEFTDDNGNTLGTEKVVNYKTVNMGLNTAISTLMMFGMIAVMIVFGVRSSKKEATEAAKEKESKVNPYKESKRTGKSVESIVEKDQRDKAKRAAKAAKRQAEMEDEEDDNGNYKVRAPRPISAAGSTYITGRKALAEARKAEEEARKAQRKAQSKKGKKK